MARVTESCVRAQYIGAEEFDVGFGNRMICLHRVKRCYGCISTAMMHIMCGYTAHIAPASFR
jgi:hypothetical protein